jgi:hypothetical protein
MTSLPLTVLFHEGPTGRAYLEMLHRCGRRPQKIIHMLPAPGLLGRLTPRGIRASGLAAKREKSANHWPRVLAKQYPGLTLEMTRTIETAFDLGDGFLQAIRSGVGLERYSDQVETAEMSGFNDPRFVRMLNSQPQSLILFTGGGELPAAVFEAQQISFLHVHPGFLPHVRGADGLLWSTLVRGRPGASALIMQPGQDVGGLVEAVETEPLRFAVPAGEHPDDQSLYRLLSGFYTPAIQAYLLARIIPFIDNSGVSLGRPVNMSKGETYNFMGPRMRHHALSIMFNPKNRVWRNAA